MPVSTPISAGNINRFLPAGQHSWVCGRDSSRSPGDDADRGLLLFQDLIDRSGERGVVVQLAEQLDQRAGTILIGDQLGPAVLGGVDAVGRERGNRVFKAFGGDQPRTLRLELVLRLPAGQVQGLGAFGGPRRQQGKAA